LSDEQDGKIKALAREALAAQDAQTQPAQTQPADQLAKALFEKVWKDVLTEEQRKALEQPPASRPASRPAERDMRPPDAH
jgi:hypothetical protein